MFWYLNKLTAKSTSITTNNTVVEDKYLYIYHY